MNSFRAYLRKLYQVSGWKLPGVIGLMTLLSVTEGIGLLLLIPILQLAGLNVSHGNVGRLGRLVTSAFAFLGLKASLEAVLLSYGLLMMLYALLNRSQSLMQVRLQSFFAAQLRRELYAAIAHSNWLFFSRRRASDFTHALTSEIERISLGTYQLLFLLATGLTTAVYLFLAFRLSVTLTGLVVASAAGLSLIARSQTRKSEQMGRRLTAAMRAVFAGAGEYLAAMKISKSYGATSRTIANFDELASEVAETYVGNVQSQAASKVLFDIGSVAILVALIYVSIKVEAMTAGTLVLLLFLFARLMPRAVGVQQALQQVVNMTPAFDNVTRLQHECEVEADRAANQGRDVIFEQKVGLDSVSFGYSADSPLVLDEIALAIPAGKTTAIVGSSGSGKTTMADLVMGLMKATSGSVVVDGVSLADIDLDRWRAQIAYVAQDTFLFHQSVRENLLWAQPDASEEAMWQALHTAAAADFVRDLPQGLDTLLGDRGVRLSGGERQRLALARALLRQPRLLILDEATSNLDSENELRIQGSLAKLHGRLTMLIIAHRLSTVRDADRIYVLESGRVTEGGTWAELTSRADSRLLALARAQSLEDAPSGPSGTHHLRAGRRGS